MTTSVVTADFDMTVDEVCELLLQHHVSGLPVLDRKKKLVGVLSEYDLLALVFDVRFGSLSIREFLSGNLVTIDEDQPLSEAADCFVRYNVRRLPVLKEGRLVGVLTRRDLLTYVRRLRQATRHVIPQPRSLRFSSKQEIARRCGISASLLRRKMASGEFRTTKEDGCYVVCAEDIEALRQCSKTKSSTVDSVSYENPGVARFERLTQET